MENKFKESMIGDIRLDGFVISVFSIVLTIVMLDMWVDFGIAFLSIKIVLTGFNLVLLGCAFLFVLDKIREKKGRK